MHFQLQDSVYRIRQYHVPVLTLYSYLFDWGGYILLLTTFIVYGRFAPPFFHEFSLSDINLMHSYKTEAESSVPIWLLIIIAGGLPLLQFIGCSLWSKDTLSTRRRLWDIQSGILVLTGSMACQLMVTCILKNICGLPRPDLLARCEPGVTEIDTPFTLATIGVCETDDIDRLWEGFRSFPSGHSSTVFCGMVVSSLNISGKLQVFDRRGLSIKVVLAILPLMVACFVSCTRISDNRHFLRDVIGGSFIGSTIGVWFYLQYFPSIFDLQNSGRAYPPRRLGISKFFNNVGGFWNLHDKLPGSYVERTLNDSGGLGLSQFADVTDEDLMDVEKNIKKVNSVGKKLQEYIDMEQIGRGQMGQMV